MDMDFINRDCFATLTVDQFNAVTPYPWVNFQAFLSPEKFAELHKHFPSLDLFEWHQYRSRRGGQRPHNRYYLAYETSIYTKIDHKDKGIVQREELPEVWQSFLQELNEGSEYRDFIASMLGVDDFRMRYAWHIGVTNSEVSPHSDSRQKLGTHIFYFNTDDDWDTAWGGELLVLGGKLTKARNPDFDEFLTAHPVPFLNNRSFLFKNTTDAWHGVKAFTCPEGRYRRLFNAIFEPVETRWPSLASSLGRMTSRWCSRTQP
ncbi:hypothetical protein NKDENANG_01666 [Candidatus Entotheonellaceae bacterium PAL068K]